MREIKLIKQESARVTDIVRGIEAIRSKSGDIHGDLWLFFSLKNDVVSVVYFIQQNLN